MRLNSVSGFTCFVKDLKKTVKFYESLGFRLGKHDDMHATFYLNWYSIDFLQTDPNIKDEFTKEATAEPKGSGIYVNIKIMNADESYSEILKLGYKPSSQPRDWPWGNREFVLRDPDGYKLVFFQKLK